MQVIETPQVCTKCHTRKSEDEFYMDYRRGRRSRECKACNLVRTNAARVRSGRKRGYTTEENRRHQLMAKYGITLEKYNEMLDDQEGVCALCHKECPTGRRLAVDHDHETGRVRGLLCAICNLTLGRFGDSVEGFERVVSYLKGT